MARTIGLLEQHYWNLQVGIEKYFKINFDKNMNIKMTKAIIHVILFSIILSSGIIAQEIQKSKLPGTIAFNGMLTDDFGKAFEDNFYDFTFSLYSQSDPNTPKWSEVHKKVLVKNGEFDVVLGKGTTPNPFSFEIDEGYSLGIRINNEKEMSDRFKFLNSPYSLGAKFAESVSDNSITSEKLADGSVTNEKVKNISINKITNLPSSIGTLARLKAIPQILGSDYEWWTTQGNIIYGPERHFLGVLNDRNFVIQTWEIQRMLFDPLGYVVIGTTLHNAHFEVIGKSTFTDDAFIKGVLGVGVYPTSAKMHINNETTSSSLKADYQGSNLFEIEGNGRTTIRSSVSGNDWLVDNYPLYIDAVSQGIAIRVEGNDWLLSEKANGDNNYMSFWTEDNLLAPIPTIGFSGISNIGNMAGRIEGQTVTDYWSDMPNIIHGVYIVALGAAEIVALSMAVLEPVDIITIAIDLAENIIIEGLNMANIGVTFESGSGDYAEWLEKSDKTEKFYSGDIIGVKGGKISKKLDDAEFFMAISSAPIVLGNSPTDGHIEDFEKVAFMGQIPVSVRGIVNEGDFIIPSGLNDGTGYAIAPELLTLDEYPSIVGQAWSSSKTDGITLINTHVGLDNKDLGYIVKNIETADKEILIGMKKMDIDLEGTKDEAKYLQKKLTDTKVLINEIFLQLENGQNVSHTMLETL